MDVNNWIEEVHRNKHNMIPVVKLAISKPIEALLVPSNLTNDFPKSLRSEIKQRKSTTDKIMLYLSTIGNTSSGTDEQVWITGKSVWIS